MTYTPEILAALAAAAAVEALRRLRLFHWVYRAVNRFLEPKGATLPPPPYYEAKLLEDAARENVRRGDMTDAGLAMTGLYPSNLYSEMLARDLVGRHLGVVLSRHGEGAAKADVGRPASHALSAGAGIATTRPPSEWLAISGWSPPPERPERVPERRDPRTPERRIDDELLRLWIRD